MDYSYGFDWIIRRALVKRWEPFFKKSGRTLEVGCFEGEMTGILLESFGSMSVVEADPEWAAKVQSRFGSKVQVVNSLVEDWEGAGKFDQIFLVHTLEHIPRPREVLRKLGSMLAEGGSLFVAVPNAYALSRRIAVGMGLVESPEAVTPGEAEHGHCRTYGRESFLAELLGSGLAARAEGGVIVKTLSNGQFDAALAAGIVSTAYVDACDELSKAMPEMSASLYAVCSGGSHA